MSVAIGVDSHKQTLAAAVVDQVGKELGSRVFPNDPKGHRRALKWIASLPSGRVVGIECAGTYGAAFAWFLMERGEDVREVPAHQTFRERHRRRSAGKSDPVDAIAIARVVAREDHLPAPKQLGLVSDIRLLNDHREQLVRTRTQLANRCHRDLVILRPGYQTQVRSLRSKHHVRGALDLLAEDNSIRSELARARLEQMLTLNDEIYAVGKRIEALLKKTHTTLTQIDGVGTFVAATILGAVGDVARIRSRAAFASFAGTAPLEASSGMRKRHRMNRGGNRQLNRALHVVAKSQSRRLPQARAFVGRKMEEGRSYKEALRCLQRHLTNVVYKTLVEDAQRQQAA